MAARRPQRSMKIQTSGVSLLTGASRSRSFFLMVPRSPQISLTGKPRGTTNCRRPGFWASTRRRFSTRKASSGGKGAGFYRRGEVHKSLDKLTEAQLFTLAVTHVHAAFERHIV